MNQSVHLIVAAVCDRRYILEIMKMATLIERRYSRIEDICV
jgi:hypothetical protein